MTVDISTCTVKWFISHPYTEEPKKIYVSRETRANIWHVGHNDGIERRLSKNNPGVHHSANRFYSSHENARAAMIRFHESIVERKRKELAAAKKNLAQVLGAPTPQPEGKE